MGLIDLCVMHHGAHNDLCYNVGSMETSQISESCVDTNAGRCPGTLTCDTQDRYFQAAAWHVLVQHSAQISWVSIHLLGGDWRPREPGVAGGAGKQVYKIKECF